MNINFELYRIFCVVADEGNITKASKKLLISQPAISKQIKKLEEELGGNLFVRTKKGVILTEEGKVFYDYITKGINYIRSGENKFTDLMNLEEGILRIGVSTTIVKEFLLPYLNIFHKKYPKIKIEIGKQPVKRFFDDLRNGLVDLVFYFHPYEFPTDAQMIICKEIHNCFVVGEEYKELSLKKTKLKELEKYPFVFYSPNSTTRKFVDDFFHKYDIKPKLDFELASHELVREFTKIGFGIGVSTREFIKKELEEKTLYELNVEPSIPSRYISLAYSKTRPPTFSAKKMIEIITKNNDEML